MVKVYFSDYSKKLSDSEFSEYLSFLPSELKQRIVRYRNWEDQYASLYGKLLLMKALDESGFNSDLKNLQYSRFGRPYLEGTPDFNISHSHFVAVCALALQGRIGADIEQIKPVSIYDFENEFSGEEWNQITQADNPNYWFYYYWTAKEAAIKAAGTGLSLPLNTIVINNNKIKIDDTQWFIKHVTIKNNYILQIATDEAVRSDIAVFEIFFKCKL